jgi:NAD(P)-dependent dehydrogenase (short-subunit alcohol dehydrogenase family)
MSPGPVAVVTGANRGIGKAAVEGLSRAGFHVVLVCRRSDDGEHAARDIMSRVPQITFDVVAADLSSRASVHALATTLLQRYPHVQVLVNNAAVALKRRTESVDGIEMTLAVNHLAAFALTLRLLESLKGGSRVVTVSSGSQRHRKIVLDDLDTKRRPYNGVRAYGETKLMNVLFTKELARRGAALGISAFAVHPGVIATNLLLDYLPLQPLLRPLVKRLSGTPEEGADTAVWLASAPGVIGESGGYFIKRRQAPPNPLALDASLARRLWDASERLTGVTWPP